MTIRVVIVDDEPLARDGVALALDEEPDVEIVAQSGDGGAAIRAVREHQPDLVFLDVKMPGLSGFDVVEAVGVERMPAVIFLTAYEQHALRAFRVNAVDYLLKPLDRDDLAEALARVRRRMAQQGIARQSRELRGLLEHMESGAPPGDGGRIVVRSNGRLYFLDPDEIVYIEAAGDYVTLHTAEQTHLVRDSMHKMAERLLPYGFQRIHRSTIVNLKFIRELSANDAGDYEVLLQSGSSLKMSRTYRDALYAALRVAG